jgi:hypothetical protein
MDIASQARENREYVRTLLWERQPDFAIVLESVVQEPCCPACLDRRHSIMKPEARKPR